MKIQQISQSNSFSCPPCGTLPNKRQLNVAFCERSGWGEGNSKNTNLNHSPLAIANAAQISFGTEYDEQKELMTKLFGLCQRYDCYLGGGLVSPYIEPICKNPELNPNILITHEGEKQHIVTNLLQSQQGKGLKYLKMLLENRDDVEIIDIPLPWDTDDYPNVLEYAHAFKAYDIVANYLKKIGKDDQFTLSPNAKFEQEMRKDESDVKKLVEYIKDENFRPNREFYFDSYQYSNPLMAMICKVKDASWNRIPKHDLSEACAALVQLEGFKANKKAHGPFQPIRHPIPVLAKNVMIEHLKAVLGNNPDFNVLDHPDYRHHDCDLPAYMSVGCWHKDSEKAKEVAAILRGYEGGGREDAHKKCEQARAEVRLQRAKRDELKRIALEEEQARIDAERNQKISAAITKMISNDTTDHDTPMQEFLAIMREDNFDFARPLDADGNTAMHICALSKSGYAKEGISIANEKIQNIDIPNSKGQTPAMLAIESISKCNNPNETRTCLAKFKFILEQKPDIELPDNNKQRLLHYACKYQSKFALLLLLSQNPDIMAQDNEGKTPGKHITDPEVKQAYIAYLQSTL